MAHEAGITDFSLADLRARRSAKWTWYPEDVLPAWVAEMDFPLAAPIREALRAAVDATTPATRTRRAGSATRSPASPQRRYGWEVDPAQVTPLNDVVAGLRDLLRVLTEPGDGRGHQPARLPPVLRRRTGDRPARRRGAAERTGASSTSTGSSAPSPPARGV